MLLKFALTALFIGVVWAFFIRSSGPKQDMPKRVPKRVPRVETLGRCDRCGVYRVYGEGCACPDTSAS